MKISTKFLVVFSAVVLVSELSVATVRMVPRSDYAQGKKGLDKITTPISDVTSGLGHIIANEPLGGKYDLVYQENSDGSVAQVLRCPTVKECGSDKECAMQPQFWQCEQVYQANKQELCRYYTAGARAYKAATWAVDELTAGFIVDQIAFFNHGIGLLYQEVTEVMDDFELAQDLIHMSCKSNGMGAVLKNASEQGLVIVHEKQKEQVSDILTIFNTNNVKAVNGTFPRSYQDSGQFNELPKIQLIPNIIDNGIMSSVNP